MKSLILIFIGIAILGIATSFLPLIDTSRKPKFVFESGGETKGVSKHNLNRGQLRKMDWLRFVDKA